MPLANPKSTQLLSDHSLAAKLGSTYGFRCSAKLLINNEDLPQRSTETVFWLSVTDCHDSWQTALVFLTKKNTRRNSILGDINLIKLGAVAEGQAQPAAKDEGPRLIPLDDNILH